MTSDLSGRTRPPVGSFDRMAPGSRIAGYLIEERIGAGGMAVVFRARDEMLKRLAAVKIIAPSMADDDEFRARFLRESRTAAAVDSPHILPVYAAGEADGLLYIATRYVPGGDLAALIRRIGGPLEPGRAVTLVEQVASALDAAHASGLVHRDVKPHNILVDTVPERPEHTYLTDFGLSKGPGASTRLTGPGQFLGTPDYAAPEQIRGGQVDGRADQYALGCVAFALLTGTLPFHHEETVATMFAHLQDKVPSLTRLRPQLPFAVDGVVARAMAKVPVERYPRCRDFAAALREALAADPRAGDPHPAPARVTSARQAPAADPWAWLARNDEQTRTAEPPVRQPPAAFVAGWATAIGQNAAYATVADQAGGAGHAHPATVTGPASGQSGGSRGKKLRVALVGVATAALLAAAGMGYAATRQGGPPASSAAPRPSKPTLIATLTVPGGGTVDTAWFSPDGKFIAASGEGSTIYVWNTASHAAPTELMPPSLKIGPSMYSTVIDNVAFSADDSSLIALVYPNVPSGAATPGYESAYAVYRWSLAAGGSPTMVWSLQTPSTIADSNDLSTAVTSQGSTVTQVTLSPELNTAPPVTLPGGADQAYPPPYELDSRGDRMIYHPTSGETYVWDFTADSVIAKLKSSAYTVLSTDGKTILTAHPSNYPSPAKAGRAAPPALWDVGTRSNVTPTDPRWKEQLRQPWQVYSWETFSTDGSVILTRRADGMTDLWSTVTHKYLLTITDPAQAKDNGFELAASGGNEVLILATSKTVNGENEFRQIKLWETQLSPSAAPSKY